MRLIASLFIILFSVNTFAVIPPQFNISVFKSDIKFSGVVSIDEAKAIYTDSNEICAVSYKAKVLESIYGIDKEKIISLHMYKDIRGPEFSFFEVGANYFIYSESLDTHEFIQLSDGLYRFPVYPKECDGSKDSLYIYREFSGKILTVRGATYIEAPGLHLISDAASVSKVFFSPSNFEYVVKNIQLYQAYKEKLDYLGMEKEAFMQFFAAGLKKP